jgi:hypothetical protein
MNRTPIPNFLPTAVGSFASPVGNLRDDRSQDSSRWDIYVAWMRRNRSKLLLWEGLVDRLLWWYPGQSEGPAWRQLLWSLAQLQHLAIDVALQDEMGDGVTIDSRSSSRSSSRSNAGLPYRIALTVLHSLWPAIYDSLARSSPRRRNYWELRVEQIRFLCRVTILVRHWMSDFPPGVLPGLLQTGGLLPSPPAPSLVDEGRRLARLAYVGRRTGRRLLLEETNIEKDSAGTRWGGRAALLLRIGFCEVLHVSRPLFWAHCKYRHGDQPGQLWQSWLLSFGMDVTSLACLRGADTNAASREEWKRRRLRLLLYLLRPPFGDGISDPVSHQIHRSLEHIPLLGNILSAYLQDWLYYWKVYHLEE